MSIELTTATNAERQNIVNALVSGSVTIAKEKIADFPAVVTLGEAQAGVITAPRLYSPLRVAQAITALGSPTPTIVLDTGGIVFFLGTPSSISDNQFQDDSSLTGLFLGSSVTTISNSAFSGCAGFTGSLTLPNSVTTIGSGAFYNCSGFTGSLTIPNSVTSIGSYAFYNCSGFTGSLTIPSSVTSIGNNAFSGCSGFTGSLTIGSGVTSIGSRAFYVCSGFTGSLTIPSSVTSIGSNAFDGCTGITNVQCRVTKTIIDAANNAFQTTGITTINARISDGTWTAGAGQTIAGQSGITVIKDLV